MAASTFIKHFTDGIIKLKDGTGTPVELQVPFSVGDLKIDGLKATQRETSKYEARGALTGVRHGAKKYPTGSFTFQIADYSDASDRTVLDFITKKASYSANVSTLGSSQEVYTIDIVLTVEGSNFGDSADHVLTYEDCDCTVSIAEGEPNTATVSFEILGAWSHT